MRDDQVLDFSRDNINIVANLYEVTCSGDIKDFKSWGPGQRVIFNGKDKSSTGHAKENQTLSLRKALCAALRQAEHTGNLRMSR